MAKGGTMRVKVVSIGEIETVGSNGFQKRMLETMIEGEYPEHFQFEFVKDQVKLLDEVLEDTYVTVSYNLQGRKVTENKEGFPLEKPMFFTALKGWKIEM
jgi:Domain of unknown function (DUF3127)